jgi:hypothetical protein
MNPVPAQNPESRMNPLLRHYRIFDIVVACEFSLPGLITAGGAAPDWRVVLAEGEVGKDEWLWFHSWKGPNGLEMMAVARRGSDCQLKFNGLAAFVIEFDSRRILVFPLESCPESTLAHLLLDQVIPRALCHQGRMVVHASAVELPNGRAVAFTGPSGQGKSTLATAFFQAGHSLLSDDCLLLENRGGVVHAMASYPSLRLWPDSAQAMVDESELAGAEFSEMAHYTHKKQLLLGDAADTAGTRWMKLAGLYILESPDELTGTSRMNSLLRVGDSDVRVRAAGGMASIMTLIESLFALDVVAEESVRRGFETVRRVASGVSIKRLTYPREYSRLPDVIETVIGETADNE